MKETLKCRICGLQFKNNIHNAKYCSIECKKKARNEKMALWLKERGKARNEMLDKLSNIYNKCWYCGLEWPLQSYHLDHIIPKSKGGSDTIENRALACGWCNMAKSNMSKEAFISWLKFIHSDNFNCYMDKPLRFYGNLAIGNFKRMEGTMYS